MSQSSKSQLSRSSVSTSASPETPRTSSQYAGSSSSTTAVSARAGSPRNESAMAQANNEDEILANRGHNDIAGSVVERRRVSAQRRRHGARNSGGGFLLDDSVSLVPRERDTKPTSHHQHQHGSIRRKTKEKREDEDKILPEIPSHERIRHPKHRLKPSIGGSPLAVELTPTAVLEHESPSVPSRNGQKKPYFGLNGSVNKPQVARTQNANNRSPSHETFDSDPAQIVNLALNLSENRRRYFSSNRLPALDATGSRRVVSASHLSPIPSSPGVGGAMRHHVSQQRRDARNLSPRADKAPDKPSRSSSALSGTRDSEASVRQPCFDTELHDDVTFTPSDATVARAEKARTALELAYEYRRLLQYLPKLPAPQVSRPSTARISSTNGADSQHTLGRQYNPLQYVRNRKVRIRERKRFNAEDSGWKEVKRVRSWVDDVIGAREDHIEQAGNQYPLAPFSPLLEEVPLPGNSPASSLKHTNSIVAQKYPPVPRIDWSTNAWDLLADAFWIEQDDHKYLLEDRNGHKLFKPPHARINSIQAKNSDITKPNPRRSASIPRPAQRHERMNSLPISVNQDPAVTNERGRATHRFNNSVTSIQQYSSSRERKSGWAQKLIRSASSSSSEDSFMGAREQDGKDGKVKHRRTSQERRDSAILERQMVSLLAQEAQEDDKGTKSVDSRPKDLGSKSHTSSRQPSYTNKQKPVPLPTTVVKKTISPRSLDFVSKKKHGHRISTTEVEYSPQTGDDTDTTAPNSPARTSHFPSIAINLAPPDDSDNRVEKPIPLPYVDEPGVRRNLSSEKLDETDFARGRISPIKRTSSHSEHGYFHSDIPAIANEYLSPKAAKNRLAHRKSSEKSAKSDDEPQSRDHSRLRDKFRGSRLGELMGAPVSKLGGLVRKRDGYDPSTGNGSSQSSYTSDASETDEEPRSGSGRTMSRKTTGNTLDDKFGPSRTSTGDSRFYTSNLPVFRSPFDENNDNEDGMDDFDRVHSSDHISRQSSAIRERSRSSRFNRLAPSRLNTKSTSQGMNTPSLHRLDTSATDITFGTTASANNERRGGRRDANAGLPYVGHLSQRIPISGLTNLGTQAEPSSTPSSDQQRRSLADHRSWSMATSTRKLSPSRAPLTKADVVRVRALLLSSGVKAAEIARRAHTIDSPPKDPILRSLLIEAEKNPTDPFYSTTEIKNLLASQPLPRFREHRLAAHILVSQVDHSVTTLNQSFDTLMHTTLPPLHNAIRALDDEVSQHLTSLVRSAADDADALSAELNTSRTLDVKRLDEGIGNILRKRRRREGFLLARRLGWASLEWLLKGLMWVVWGIVVVVRGISGVLSVFVRVVKWLLWL